MLGRLILVVIPFVLSGCGANDDKSDQGQSSPAQIKKLVGELSTKSATSNDKFKNIYSKLKDLNSELPNINKVGQKQITDLNSSSLEIAHNTKSVLDKQFQQMNKMINDFGADVAKKGY